MDQDIIPKINYVYDLCYRGYGRNKIAFFEELSAMNFRFGTNCNA